MSEDKPASRISSVKKRLESAGLTDQPTQRVSSIVAKSKDPSSALKTSTSGSLLRKKLTSTINNSGSNIASSLKQNDDEIKKNRRKSFGEQKESSSTATSTTATTTATSTSTPATSKLKPKSSLTGLGSSTLSSVSKPTTSSKFSTSTASKKTLTKSTTEPSEEKEKSVKKSTNTITTPATSTTTVSSSPSNNEEKQTTTTTTTLPPASSSLLSSVIYTKPLKDSDDFDSSSKKETTITPSTPSTPSINKVVNKLKRKSIESGNIFQFDQAKEEAVAAITNTDTQLQISKDKSEKDKKKQRVEDEQEEQDELEESLGLKKKKTVEKKKKSSLKKSKSTEDNIDNEEGEKKKKKKRVSTIISTTTTSGNPEELKEEESLFDGSSSVIGTTSNIATKKSKAYPKTPLPNKIKSFDEIMEDHDNQDEDDNDKQQQQPIITQQQKSQAQYYQPPNKFTTNNYNNNNINSSPSHFSSSINSRVYYTPRSTPATPNTTSASIHNYPESPSPAQVANGFQYSNSPISIPNISNISYLTPSEADISFATDEKFFNTNPEEEREINRQRIQEERKRVIANSKLGESKSRYVLLVISFATWFYLIFVLLSFFYHFNDPVFCNTGVIPKRLDNDRFSCIPCPDKGICNNGLFESCIDGYVPRNDECILNPNKVESLVSTISQIDLILRDRRGLYECGSKETFYMTADELMKEIAKRNWFSKNKAVESFNTILEFIDNKKNSEEIGLDSKLLSPISVTFEDDQFKYYTNNQSIRPLWCQTIFFFKNLIKSNLHWIGIVVIGIVSFKVYQYNKKKKQEELLAIDKYTKLAIRILQEHKEFEEPYVSDIILKDDVVGTTDDKRLNKIWDKVVERLSSNVKVKNTVRLIHGESRTTFEWADNRTPRKSIQSPVEFDHDEKSKDFGYNNDLLEGDEDSFN